MTQVIIGQNDIWGYFQDEKKDLQTNMHLIASNDMYGIEIYLSNEDGEPCFTVEVDGNVEYMETVSTEDECICEAIRIYNLYLYDDAVHELINNQKKIDNNDIKLREKELNQAFEELLDIVCDYDIIGLDQNKRQEVVEDIKEHVLEYMYRKHKLNVFRPMYLTDSNGDFYEEYPYEHMIFSDPLNPLYATKA